MFARGNIRQQMPDGPARRASAPRQALRRVATWLRRGERSAVALEFGIIAVPFFVMFLGIMEMSYDLYVQAELDNAVDLAARSVQVGSATGSVGEKSSAYVTQQICPNLGGLLDCNLLTVAVAPIPAGSDYYQDWTNWAQNLTEAEANAGCAITTGTAGQMMVLKAWYDGPTFVGLLVPTFTKIAPNGNVVHQTVSSAGFVNEYFSGPGQPSTNPCS